jgi:hypothetical protein
MRTFRGIIAVVALIFSTVSGIQENRPADHTAKVEVYLSTDKNWYEPREIVHVRVELKNSGERPILIGREMSSIGNWPFSIWLRLVDSSGKYAQPARAAFVDPPPTADLSTKEGVLRWWTTLDSGYFYGKDLEFPLESPRPGHYQLQGDYYSAGLTEQAGTTWNAKAKEMQAFGGKVHALPAQIEVRPLN